MNELYEKLADIEHQRWSHWMKYQFSLCAWLGDGSMVIPPDSVKHWLRQISVDYSDLTEQEKDSDREEVERYWHLIQEKLAQKEARIRELEELLDMLYHLRFVDDTISHEDNMKLWDKIEKALSDKSNQSDKEDGDE